MGQHPLIGKPAPPLSLPNTKSTDLYTLPIGQKPIALFFFPAAGTMGCTMEACSFRDAQTDNITFKRHSELEVVGISGDDTTKLSGFADENKLSYLFLSDKGGKARKDYMVSKSFFGLSEVSGRVTFFIDNKGIVRGTCDNSIWGAAHVSFVEKMLKETEKESQ